MIDKILNPAKDKNLSEKLDLKYLPPVIIEPVRKIVVKEPEKKKSRYVNY